MDDVCKCLLTGKQVSRGIVGNTVCVNLDIPSLKGGQGVGWAHSKQRSLRSCLLNECVVGVSLPQCAAGVSNIHGAQETWNICGTECDPCLVKKPFYFQDQVTWAQSLAHLFLRTKDFQCLKL